MEISSIWNNLTFNEDANMIFFFHFEISILIDMTQHDEHQHRRFIYTKLPKTVTQSHLMNFRDFIHLKRN